MGDHGPQNRGRICFKSEYRMLILDTLITSLIDGCANSLIYKATKSWKDYFNIVPLNNF